MLEQRFYGCHGCHTQERAKMLEREVERFLVREVKRIGGRCYKFVSPGNAGVPDRIVVLPNESVKFIELKTDKGRLTKLQEIQIKRLKDLGQEVYILHGMKGVKEFIGGVQTL